jgi:hypothetical protein
LHAEAAKDDRVSERARRAVEVASIVVIGLAILAFGWALLQNLARFRVASAVALGIVAMAQAFALRRDFAEEGRSDRVRSTRDVALMTAILIALTYVISPQRWAIGACIATLEFAIVFELLAWFAPAPPERP